MAVLTLGVPFATGSVLALVIGAAAYVLGWVFVGDSRWFRRKVDEAELARLGLEEEKALVRIHAERDALLHRLPAEAGRRYSALAEICRDIEDQAGAAPGLEGSFPAEKLDGLMWSYLGLLGNEAHLDAFIAREQSEDFAGRMAALEKRLRELEAEIAAAEPGSREYETRMQLIGSRQEGLEAIRRRHQQFLRAQENLRLVRAEQERIAEQLKLIRSDLYASKAVGRVSERVNDTIDQLASTGRISGEVPPVIQDLPALRTRRVGYRVQSE